MSEHILEPGESITLEFGGGPQDLTTGHEATVTDDGVTITFTEPLSWHVEYAPETMQGLGFTDWRPSFPTTMQAALERVLRAGNSLPSFEGQLSFDLIYMGDTEIALEFALSFGVESLEWDSETLHSKAWPFIATVANMVDPGTFGGQYLFTALARAMEAAIHPGAFVALKTGTYNSVLWGDHVSIPAFMVERIEGDTVHCFYPPYSFKWPLDDLIAVERPTAYGANHDDWINEYRMAFTYATEYESEYDDAD